LPTALRERALSAGPFSHCPADVDDIVGDHTEADPALHSDEAPVTAPVEAMSAFDHADAALTAGAPFLANCGTSAFFCSRLRSALLVERLGMQSRLTPLALAAASFLLE
jgi:hypothetical protein